VSDLLKKMPSLVLKILSLGCLLAFLTFPALAQDQTPKDQGAKNQAPAPKEAPAPRALRTMSPRPATKATKGEEEDSRKMPETLEQKKVTGAAGGQEIRNKPGEEDK
jgi:hypothetical protein